MHSDKSDQWYAIHTRYRHELLVSILYPSYEAVRNWNRRSAVVRMPIFPGYIFCRLDVQRRLPILMTPGVVGIIGTGKTPVPLDDREVQSIETAMSARANSLPYPYLRPGREVEIPEGPLRGLTGTIIAVKNNYRIVVSVPLLQRSMAVEIDAHWLRGLPIEPLQLAS
jgi:transcription antitermination factor NusG